MAFHLTGAIAGGGVLLRAIVFDFFGTLTDPTRESGRRTAYNAMVRVIGIPGEKFWQAVTDSYTEAATGVLGGTTETLTDSHDGVGLSRAFKRSLTRQGLTMRAPGTFRGPGQGFSRSWPR